jgi:hypothetical protein
MEAFGHDQGVVVDPVLGPERLVGAAPSRNRSEPLTLVSGEGEIDVSGPQDLDLRCLDDRERFLVGALEHIAFAGTGSGSSACGS